MGFGIYDYGHDQGNIDAKLPEKGRTKKLHRRVIDNVINQSEVIPFQNHRDRSLRGIFCLPTDRFTRKTDERGSKHIPSMLGQVPQWLHEQLRGNIFE
jgi:hypothetical protein